MLAQAHICYVRFVGMYVTSTFTFTPYIEERPAEPCMCMCHLHAHICGHTYILDTHAHIYIYTLPAEPFI